LRQRGCALRIRHEDGHGVLTFKGPVTPDLMKVRDEHETAVDDPASLRRVLEGLGFQPWFTYEKFRTEFTLATVVAAIDETPVGTFVELEGSEAGILEAAAKLRRTPDDFVLGSYRALFLERRSHMLLSGNDMVFPSR
jgi:adenylate cyclase class 2